MASHRQFRRSRKTGQSQDEDDSSFDLAVAFERIGTTLRLVNRLIQEDRAGSDRAMVLRHDREVAVQLLVQLLSDPRERGAYERFLSIAMPQTPRDKVPDDLTVQFITDRRWSQLSSGFLAEFLLNPTAIRYVAAKLADAQPAAWVEWLFRF